ncbi:hypothetical protein BJX66DRAFT_336191 [Aspergillus keveii]|uniref:Uncharacterized protein n=1 Tax=Aspergillus keveii TaxID=714993 RepID=A0ABR4GAX3_9EURO
MHTRVFISCVLLLLIPLALGTSLDRALASLNSLTPHLESVQQASRNYNGGIPSTTSLMLAAYRLDRAVQDATSAFDTLNQLTTDEVERWEEAYTELFPIASETANSYAGMGPVADRMGYAPFVPAFTQMVEARTNLLFESMFRAIPAANGSLVSGARREVQQIFQGVRARLA